MQFSYLGIDVRETKRKGGKENRGQEHHPRQKKQTQV